MSSYDRVRSSSGKECRDFSSNVALKSIDWVSFYSLAHNIETVRYFWINGTMKAESGNILWMGLLLNSAENENVNPKLIVSDSIP